MLQDFLTRPEIQSFFVPLVCSLVLALFLRKLGEQWMGLAIIGGFLATITLTVGLEFQPLTSTRKIILSSLFLPFVALLLDLYRQKKAIQLPVLMIMVALASIWVVWPVLLRQEGAALWIMAGKVSLYGAGVIGIFICLVRDQVHRESGALLGLGIGTGVCSFIAASALYAQLSFALAAATGGMLLVFLFGKYRFGSVGNLGLFAAAIPLALIGSASTVYAKLPAIVLIFMILIPVFAIIPLVKNGNFWLRSAVSTILALLPVIPAVWITWQAAGPVVF